MTTTNFTIGTIGFSRILFGIYADNAETVTDVVTIDETNGGAIELKTSGFQGQLNTTYASNIAYYISDAGTGTGKVEITALELSKDVATKVLGDKEENGILSTYSNVTQPYVSVIAEAEDLQGKKMWIGIAKAKFGTPDGDELKTSEDKGKTPNHITLTGSAITRRSDKLVKSKASETSGATFTAFATKMFPGFSDISKFDRTTVSDGGAG